MGTRKADGGAERGAPALAPSSADVVDAKAWLRITDGRKAWAWLVGRRVRALRTARVEQSRQDDFGPRRGVESRWRMHGANFSQEAFASRLGFRQSWLAKIETGARSAAIFDIYHIAEALGVDAWEILKPPSEEERVGMEEVKATIARRRKRGNVTPEQVAAHCADAQNKKLRDTPRSAREQERLEVTRKALPKSTRKPGRPPRKQ